MSKAIKIRSYLKPVGWIFGNISRLRRFLFEKGVFSSYKPNIPVICIGNLAIGGTGKTPHAAFVTNILSQDRQVAMLSRGYGRKSKGFVLANTTPALKLTPHLIGYEPLLLHQRFPNLPLAVDRDRENGIKRLQEYDPTIKAIVMDDAYQHLSTTPTLRMILTEYSRPYFKDYPMPAGRLREFPDAVRAADMVVVTKVDDDAPNIDRKQWRKQLGIADIQPLFFTKYKYVEPEAVTRLAKSYILQHNTNIILLTGIANPAPLLEHLKHQFNNIQHLSFPDHHIYSENEIKSIIRQHFSDKNTSTVLFTTEKDWMRLLANPVIKTVSLLSVFILPIEIDFVFDNEKNEFINILENHVRREEKKN